MVQIDLKKLKVNEVKSLDEYKKENRDGFLRPENLLNEDLIIGNVETIKMNDLDGLEFDVRRIEKDDQIERLRTFSKVLFKQLNNLKEKDQLPIKVRFRLRISKAGYEYVTLK